MTWNVGTSYLPMLMRGLHLVQHPSSLELSGHGRSANLRHCPASSHGLITSIDTWSPPNPTTLHLSRRRRSQLQALVQPSCGPLMTMLRKSVTIKSRGPADFFRHLAVIVSSNLPNLYYEVQSCHVTPTISQDSAYTSLLVSFHSWFLSIG